MTPEVKSSSSCNISLLSIESSKFGCRSCDTPLTPPPLCRGYQVDTPHISVDDVNVGSLGTFVALDSKGTFGRKEH